MNQLISRLFDIDIEPSLTEKEHLKKEQKFEHTHTHTHYMDLTSCEKPKIY